MYGAFCRFFRCGACGVILGADDEALKVGPRFFSVFGSHVASKRGPKSMRNRSQKNVRVPVTPGIAFLMDFASEMGPKREAERLPFPERPSYQFLKDVPNETPTFGVAQEPDPDPSRH